MDWNESTARPFVPRPESSLSFFYNYNNCPYPGMEVKQPAMAETSQRLLPAAMEQMNINIGSREKKKKKRLTSNQIESLERSFQEEIKLDPERKMKLSRELGLQPRQIAVWFQNRRTRWKNKQLESLYDVLKHEYDVVSKEKQKLQEEVMKLKARLREQAFMTQTFAAAGAGGGYNTDQHQMSGEETVESTSEALRGSNKPQPQQGTSSIHQNQQGTAEGYNNNSSNFTVEDFNTVSMPHCHWPVLPYYP